MAALTATRVTTESLGSLTLKIILLPIGSTSDTWTLYPNAPIVGAWVETQNPGSDVSYVASTGVFTVTNTSGTTATNLFILMRGA